MNQMSRFSQPKFYKNNAKKAAANPKLSTGCTIAIAPEAVRDVVEAPAAVVPVDPDPLAPVADSEELPEAVPEAVPEAEPVTDGTD